MSLWGCQINSIDVNFHLQKSLEIFDTNSADKVQSQNYKGVKVPCLMPIRVNPDTDYIQSCNKYIDIFLSLRLETDLMYIQYV